MTNKVFVAQANPRVDIVSATKWGELIPLAGHRDQLHINADQIVKQLRNKLKCFNDDDWLLAIGDPAIIGVAFAIASSMNSGKVNILKWDKIERMYYPVKLDVY